LCIIYYSGGNGWDWGRQEGLKVGKWGRGGREEERRFGNILFISVRKNEWERVGFYVFWSRKKVSVYREWSFWRIVAK